jgi:hypothetical protein
MVNGKEMGDIHHGDTAQVLPIYLGDPARFPPPEAGLKGNFKIEIGCSAAECMVQQISLLDGSVPVVGEGGAPTKGGSSPLLGEWICQSRKGDGARFSSAYKFDADGGFAYTDPQSQMIGRFEPSGPNAFVRVDQSALGGRYSPASITLEIANSTSSPGRLAFDMTLVRVGVTVYNSCTSRAVASAAKSATRADLCSVNPAACSALQRNQDIRSQMRDQRCEILRSQLGGMIGGDYQLAKAGCQ